MWVIASCSYNKFRILAFLSKWVLGDSLKRETRVILNSNSVRDTGDQALPLWNLIYTCIPSPCPLLSCCNAEDSVIVLL